MQAIKANMVSICKLVQQPEDAVHIDLLGERKRAQRPIARQKSPSP